MLGFSDNVGRPSDKIKETAPTWYTNLPRQAIWNVENLSIRPQDFTGQYKNPYYHYSFFFFLFGASGGCKQGV